MKYGELVQIADFFKQFKKIHFIKRILDNALEIALDKENFIIDLNRSKSSIYSAHLQGKSYAAPFDIALKRLFTNATLKDVYVPLNNRILVFCVRQDKAYKSFEGFIYFELTGKHTNAIITDSKGIIIEALRHIQKSARAVKIGEKLAPLAPIEIKEKPSENISDFRLYFENNFKQMHQKRLEELKKNKLFVLEKRITNLKNKLASLEKAENLLQKSEQIMQTALLLSANLYKIKENEREFVLLDFEGNERSFKLSKPAKIEANELFKEAKKLKQKAQNIHLQSENLNEKLENLRLLEHFIKQCKQTFELESVLVKNERQKEFKEGAKDEAAGILSFYFKDFKILLGRNEKANETLLKRAKKDDLWLHVKDLPSAHVFIISNKLKMSEQVIEFAARLCVNFSNLQKGRFIVDYTQRKYVKIKQNAFVNYTNYKSISVSKE